MATEDAEPHRIGFLLIPEFPIYAVIPATEALRIANQNSGRTSFDWRFVSVDGKAVRAGNGMLVTKKESRMAAVDPVRARDQRLRFILLCVRVIRAGS